MAIQVNIHEAKTHLSRLDLKTAFAGDIDRMFGVAR